MPRVINATYAGSPCAHPADLLKTARQYLTEIEAAKSTLRSRLAGRLRQLRVRCHRAAGLRAAHRLEHKLALGLEHFERARDALIKETSRQALSLALSIAEEIVGDEVKRKPASLLRRIRKALDEIKPGHVAGIMVPPGCKDKASDLPNALMEDDSLAPGNAVISTNAGKITLNWNDHLRNVARRLYSELERHPIGNNAKGKPYAASCEP